MRRTVSFDGMASRILPCCSAQKWISGTYSPSDKPGSHFAEVSVLFRVCFHSVAETLSRVSSGVAFLSSNMYLTKHPLNCPCTHVLYGAPRQPGMLSAFGLGPSVWCVQSNCCIERSENRVRRNRKGIQNMVKGYLGPGGLVWPCPSPVLGLLLCGSSLAQAFSFCAGWTWWSAWAPPCATTLSRKSRNTGCPWSAESSCGWRSWRW